MIAREDWRAPAGRYDRQARIAGWDQGRVERARVLVVGAGAVGNEALKLLALVGVGSVTVIDGDRIERSNLSRTVLFREGDLGRPKAEVAAARAAELSPGTRIEAIVGDVEHDLGLGRVRECDVILGCVDNLGARVAVNRAAGRLGVPWVNAGIDERALEVTAFRPGDGSCYECGLGERAWRRHLRRFSCGDGVRRAAAERKVATVATVASMAAAIQVEAALALLHDPAPEGAPRLFGVAPGERLYVTLAPFSVSRAALCRRPSCMAHERWPTPRAVALTRDASLAEVAAAVPGAAALELGFDLVTGLACPACGAEEPRLAPKARLRERDLACRCGARRRLRSREAVDVDDALARAPLRALGIADRAILRLRTRAGDELVELAPAPLSNDGVDARLPR